MLKRSVAACLLVAASARADNQSTATTERGTTTAPISAKPDDEEGVPKLSLPTEADRVAWLNPGFRLGLGLVYGRMYGIHGPPDGRILGAQMHAGLRLDAQWSLYTTFQYASAAAPGALSGLRFEGTVDPTWNVTRAFSLAVGFGFGGIVEGRTSRADNAPQATDVSITLPSARDPLPSCSGVGVVGLARATYAWVLGPRASTNLELETFGQYTECVDRTGMVDPDTAAPIQRTQYWPHVGVTLSWGITWR